MNRHTLQGMTFETAPYAMAVETHSNNSKVLWVNSEFTDTRA
jgi:hypothetical protein